VVPVRRRRGGGGIPTALPARVERPFSTLNARLWTTSRLRCRSFAPQRLFYVGPEADGAVLFLKDRQGRVTARLSFKQEIVPAR